MKKMILKSVIGVLTAALLAFGIVGGVAAPTEPGQACMYEFDDVDRSW